MNDLGPLSKKDRLSVESALSKLDMLENEWDRVNLVPVPNANDIQYCENKYNRLFQETQEIMHKYDMDLNDLGYRRI
jgi:hypothetical protein